MTVTERTLGPGVSFNADLFSNREEEKKLFLETVRTTSRHEYLEFTGVAGQGKSELLKWIYHQAEQKGYLAAYIDFELAEFYSKEVHPILTLIVEQLSCRVDPERFKAFQQALDAYLDERRKLYLKSLKDEQEVDQKPLLDLEYAFIQAFNTALCSILQSHRLVLCLDSTEKAYAPAIHAFEEHVMTHYTRNTHFILVTAGQEELVWKHNEIRNLVRRYELPCFDSDAMQQQIENLARYKRFEVMNDSILNTMQELTRGHPFSTYKLVDFWTDGFQAPLRQSVTMSDFARSIRELSKQVIKERILKKFELSEEYPPVTDILWYLAPLRYIEFGTFKYVLSTCLQEFFAGKPYMFFQQLMGEFHDSYIFKRWRLGSGFDMDPIVRNILLWDMRINAPETFQDVEQTLAAQYDRWVGKTRDATQIRNMVERCYHYATYLKTTEAPDLNHLLHQELERYVDTYFCSGDADATQAFYSQLNRLYNTLEEDKDLQSLVDVPQLLNAIRERLQHPEASRQQEEPA